MRKSCQCVVISEFSEFATSEDESNSEVLLSDAALDLIFDIVLESYMTRRMLRWGRDYHYKSIDMVNKLHNICLNQKSFSLPKFIAHLAHLANSGPDRRHQDKWSTDIEVNKTLTEEWHVHITEGIRYILYRIEEKIREEKNIPTIDLSDTLRLERIMPTKWEYSLNWQLPLEEGSDRCVPYDNIFTEEHKKNNKSWRKADPSAEGLVDQSYSYALDLAKMRRKYQKSIGNLTLVDVEIDTDEFSEKKSYFENFNLEINKIIYDSENWDAPQIEKRTEDLIEWFHKLWPSSEHFIAIYLSEKYSVDSVIQGKVVEITNGGVTLELEEGIEGWIPVNEITWTPYVDLSCIVNVDDEIKVVVTRIAKPKDVMRIWLSMKPFLIEPWPRLEQEYPIGSEVTGLIRKITYHGVYVEIEDGITGKIDYSEFSWLNDRIAGTFLNEGDKIDVIVQNIDASKDKISLGFKQIPKNPWELLEEKYPIGTKVTGLIRKITNYGAFVEIEQGIDGLLHNNEFSWTNRNVSAHDFFKVGDEVEAVILKIDASEQHVSLGHKQLEQNPWEQMEQKYPIGTKVTGIIRNITDFSAFVEIEQGIYGLLHKSELSWTRQNASAYNFFKVGDEVEAVILKIDASEQRVHLGFKQLQPNPWEQIEQKYPKGTEITGHIRKLTKSGAYVETKDFDGLIRNSDISWTTRQVVAHDFFKVDEEVKAVILEIDTSKQRVHLGFKQLQPNPWEQIEQRYPNGTKVKGCVRDITKSGVFVEIEEGIDGLIHISELTDQENKKPGDIVSVGEELNMEVIQVSTEDQRIALSLKAMSNEAKNQPRWVSMIESQTIMFTTNEGRKQFSSVQVHESDVIGFDNNSKKTTFSIKRDILFAYSEEAYPNLLYHIPRRISERAEKHEKFHVEDVTLKSAQKTQAVVTATVHSGYELTGIIEGADKEAIYMQINKETVIVFRHSLCDFKSE